MNFKLLIGICMWEWEGRRKARELEALLVLGFF